MYRVEQVLDLLAGVSGDVVAVELREGSQRVVLGEADIGDEAAGLEEDGLFDELVLVRDEVFLVGPEASAEGEDAGGRAVVGGVELGDAFPD